MTLITNDGIRYDVSGNIIFGILAGIITQLELQESLIFLHKKWVMLLLLMLHHKWVNKEI